MNKPLALSCLTAAALIAGSLTPLSAAPPASESSTTRQAKQSESAGPAVTSKGFEQRLSDTTFYMTIRIEGTVGVDVTPESVRRAMHAAGSEPNVKHVVMMIDVTRTPQQGALLDKEIVDSYPGKLEVISVVREGLNFAVFPIFSSDKIFMTADGMIGGMPISRMMPPGSEEVTAKLVGIYASQLASTAESHGHNADIVRAMIDEKKQLFYWREDGKVVVSNDKPDNLDSVQSLEEIPSVTFGETLTLDQESAIRVQLVSPIDDYDAFGLSEFLEIETDWIEANHYSLVANKIAQLLAQMQEQEQVVNEIDKQIPDVRITRENRNDPEVREIQDYKRAFDQASTGLQEINTGLATLLEVHPERHAYFVGDNGETILADPAQWKEDIEEAKTALSRVRSGITQVRAALIKLEADPDHFNELEVRVNKIENHLLGIEKYGNARYWEEFYVPELPPDIYG